MPFREDAVGVLASLQFRALDDATGGGAVVLRNDGHVQFVPSPALRRSLDKVARRADTGAEAVGTLMVVVLGGIGWILFARERRTSAVGFFVASAAAGLAALSAKAFAASISPWLLGPMPLAAVQITRDSADRSLRIVANGGGLKRVVVVISADECDSAEADAFFAALTEGLSREGI